jgi:hypothetical protein
VNFIKKKSIVELFLLFPGWFVFFAKQREIAAGIFFHILKEVIQGNRRTIEIAVQFFILKEQSNRAFTSIYLIQNFGGSLQGGIGLFYCGNQVGFGDGIGDIGDIIQSRRELIVVFGNGSLPP